MASPSFRGRRILVACGLSGAFILVIVRLVNLQVMQSAELTVKADRQHQKNVTLEGRAAPSTIGTAKCWR